MLPTSISCYLNIVRLIHLEAGHDNPLVNNWFLSTVMRGIRRCRGKPPRQKLPITPEILRAIYASLDLNDSVNVAFWAACLCAFYTFCRKSSLVPKSVRPHHARLSLQRHDVTLGRSGALVTFRHSKTLQFWNRTLVVPIPRVSNSPLCPVTALARLLQATAAALPEAPLFAYHTSGGLAYLTDAAFTDILQGALARAGLPVDDYSGHSFRRGGASFAFACGIPSDIIKYHGDWKSSAYQRYLHIPLRHRLELSHRLGTAISDSSA